MARVHVAVVLCWLGTASVVSCGGASVDDDAGRAGSGASTGAGGASSAGTSGTPGTAGDGQLAEPCSLPAEPGQCNAYFPSFFHNPLTGVCEPFVYGGCGGNDNRFASVEECQAVCSGGTPDLDTCESPVDCELATLSCCGPCDGGLADYTAINTARHDQFYRGRLCTDIACEPCPAPDPTVANRPYVAATCRQGLCVPIDVREEGAADCQAQEDCRLRAGVACCEGCGGNDSSLAALNNSGTLAQLVCGDIPYACPDCEPQYPAEYVAMCESSRCVLRRSAQP